MLAQPPAHEGDGDDARPRQWPVCARHALLWPSPHQIRPPPLRGCATTRAPPAGGVAPAVGGRHVWMGVIDLLLLFALLAVLPAPPPAHGDTLLKRRQLPLSLSCPLPPSRALAGLTFVAGGGKGGGQAGGRGGRRERTGPCQNRRKAGGGIGGGRQPAHPCHRPPSTHPFPFPPAPHGVVAHVVRPRRREASGRDSLRLPPYKGGPHRRPPPFLRAHVPHPDTPPPHRSGRLVHLVGRPKSHAPPLPPAPSPPRPIHPPLRLSPQPPWPLTAPRRWWCRRWE